TSTRPRSTGGGGGSSSSTSPPAATTSTRTLNFHFKDHRGRPLGVAGRIVCHDTQTDQTFVSEPIGSLLMGESHARIAGIPGSIGQIRLEFWAEALFLNVISSTDLDQLDSLIDGRISLLSGTRRLSVAETFDLLPPALGGGTVAARMLAQDGEFTLES